MIPSQIPARFYKFARIAFELAPTDIPHRDVRHRCCALLVVRNKVISVGYNSHKTTPHGNGRLSGYHAETDCIKRAPKGAAKGAIMIVARHRWSGTPGLAKPCSSCQKVLNAEQIRKVYYTENSNSRNSIILSELDLNGY